MKTRLPALAVLLTAATAHAELPPGSYDKLRADADDAVVVLVTGVKTAAADGHTDVTVEAKVVGVERSKSGLKRGETITIRYKVATGMIVGPRPVPVLEKDVAYPAFLRKDGTAFAPAAYGESFKMTPEG